jgi:3-oxoacyl-[acyl-carrier protein] reductase
MKLKDKVALVTGGGKGIGRATCIALAREGAAVAVNYSRSAAEAEAVAQQINSEGGQAFAVMADVSKESDARALVNSTVDRYSRLNIVVNNAGWTRRTPHDQLDLLNDELVDRTLNTNVKGPIYVLRAAISHLQKAGDASVVNITSVAGITSNGSSVIYCGSKAALASMTRAWARAFAPTVRFNSVAPGFVDTGFVMPPGGEAAAGAAKRVHIKHIVQPEDIAAAVLFFCTDGSALTGEEIVMDGGIMRLGPKQ